MSLIKMADFYGKMYDYTNQVDHIMTDARSKTDGPYLSSSLIGGAAGAAMGALSKNKIAGAIIGGGLGSIAGLVTAGAVHNARATKHALATNAKYPKLIDELDKMHNMHIALHPNQYYY